MHKPIILALLKWTVVIIPLSAIAGEQPAVLQSMSLSRLEERLQYIDSHLEKLANFSLRGGVGPIGFHSKSNREEEWVQIYLDQPYPIDEIVVVPTIRRDSDKGFRADAFPEAFRILAGMGENDPGKVIAEFESPRTSPKGIEPMILPIQDTQARWVRLEATRLGKRAHSGARALLLSELMVFSGTENVALRCPVKSSSNETGWANAWNNLYLVDGQMPYLMDSAEGDHSTAWISDAGEKPGLSLDLGESYPISRIHLHSVEQGDTVPQAFAGDLGIPVHLQIKGANKADFSDAHILLDYKREDIPDAGSIMMWRIPPTSSRYVRLTEIGSVYSSPARSETSRIGFSEIEIFSDGKNIAMGKPVLASPASKSNRSLSVLTDGKNFFGKILPIREWMTELATRSALEAERPLIVAELNKRYANQKVMLRRMIQVTVLLTMGIFFIILLDRYIRMRQASRIRERIAADLHDELGADLHTIGLYGDLALDSMGSPNELEESLHRIIEFTERSGTAARHCVNILEANGICENLVEDMKDTSRRMLADLDYEISVEGDEFLHQLPPRKRIDLFLFYKECLTNILRHSEATRVAIQIASNPRTTRLEVSDDGKGFTNSSKDSIPPSLKRRARLMRAQIRIEPTDTGGTRVRLRLKNRKFGFLK